MIARPSKKFFSSKTTARSPLFSEIANDNRPPKKVILGRILLLAGFFLSLGAIFWVYERMI
jgi:hypothetical protein